MFDLQPETQILLAKPTASALAATVLDRYWTGVSSIGQNLAFGACVGGGVFVSDVASKHLPGNGIERNLEQRALEIGITATAALALDKFVFKPYASAYVLNRILTIIAAEAAGEYISESFLGVH